MKRKTIIKAHENSLCFARPNQSSSVAKCPFERVFALTVSHIVSVTLGPNGDSGTQSVVRALHEEGRAQGFFAIFEHIDEELLACLEHSISGSRDDGIRRLDACFTKCFEGRNGGSLHQFAHPSRFASGNELAKLAKLLYIINDALSQNARFLS